MNSQLGKIEVMENRIGKQIAQSWTRNRKENKPHSNGPSIGKEITVMDSRWGRTQITQSWTPIENKHKPHSCGPSIGEQITHKNLHPFIY